MTAGDLVFVGGTMDSRFHALAARSRQELWPAPLSASAHAQPITYGAGGTQFVVVAAGGPAKIDEEEHGDRLIAFALAPERNMRQQHR